MATNAWSLTIAAAFFVMGAGFLVTSVLQLPARYRHTGELASTLNKVGFGLFGLGAATAVLFPSTIVSQAAFIVGGLAFLMAMVRT